VDLQAFSGHRDTRMLLRYTHLCMPSLAKRLDEAFAAPSATTLHRGRRRLKRGAQLTLTKLVHATAGSQAADTSRAPSLPSNVYMFPQRKSA
jgi:hypothetical protein